MTKYKVVVTDDDIPDIKVEQKILKEVNADVNKVGIVAVWVVTEAILSGIEASLD